jgi:hypothetical protein
LLAIEFSQIQESNMRWVVGATFLLCTSTLLAQSLGDVARAQRNGDDRPKAKRVFTNADFASAPLEETPSISPQKQGAQPSRTIRTLNGVEAPQAVAQQRRLTELGQQVQFLESEIRDLDAQRISLKSSAVYGDVKRVNQNEEFHRLQTEIEGKHKQLAVARDEYAEEIERSQKASIVK